ncbi:HD domain-containing protein [Haloferacaceae archaeon DSL9]
MDGRDEAAGDDSDAPSDGLEALVRAFALKDERRTGWQLRGVDDPESVAGHAWGVSLLCLVHAERAVAEFADRDDFLDAERALRLAVVHDLAEAETGDFATRADPNADAIDPDEKDARERAAMDALAGPLGEALRADWEEYEARETPEAIFVKEMDLIDMCLQALVYERQGRYDPSDPDAPDAFEAYDALDEFFATAEPRLRTELGRELFAEIRARYVDAQEDGAQTGDE